MAGPRASDGEGRWQLQGTDLLNIAGEKMAGSGTLGYLKQITAAGIALRLMRLAGGETDGYQAHTG